MQKPGRKSQNDKFQIPNKTQSPKTKFQTGYTSTGDQVSGFQFQTKYFSAGGYARALSRSLVCSMNRQDFEDFLQKFTEMSFRVLKLLGFKINVLENKLQNLVFKDIRTRICNLLSSLYEKSGDRERQLIKVPLTHRDIANLMGCTRETASLNFPN
ncbi:MAG TPA: Crp/Fnr family transcriptional regulator [Caldithrix sp.]|nr:Crp/Fnr family transcriptional regulator [Caldithrix sp.]